MLRLIASTMVLAAALTGIARAADTDDWIGDVRQLLPAFKAAEYPDQIHSLLIAFKAGACMGLVDGLLIMLRSHNLVTIKQCAWSSPTLKRIQQSYRTGQGR